MNERTRREEWKIRVTSGIAGVLQRAMSATYRTRVLNSAYAHRRRAGEDVRCIYATWHASLWHAMTEIREQGVCVMVSSHRDGEIIARVLGRQGFELARGSSTRGGVRALRDFARFAERSAGDLCVTVDGPRGPAREVKEGILFVASHTGLPIVPLAVAVDRAWRLNSWDRLIIGKPFTRAAVAFGEEVRVPPKVSRDELGGLYRDRVAAALERAEAQAEGLLRGEAPA